MMDRVTRICRSAFRLDGFTEVMDYFKKLINVFKQMNYSEWESAEFKKFNEQLDEILAERIVNN
jgi:V/A-type H+-transporting ATPase subunit A